MFSKIAFALGAACYVVASVSPQQYDWSQVKIGGGGGYVPGIIFNQKQKGVAFARTDIGGAYRLNADDSWTPILDWVNNTNWNQIGTDALASDPTDANTVYIAAGLYTNSWDPMNGNILKSTDMGNTWTSHPLPFKVGGNMPGRGLGERLVIDPNNNKILYFGARSGHGLWRSTDAGVTWTNVTSFPSVGTYVQDPTDSSGYGSDIMGIGWITFDSTLTTSSGSSRVFVGVANMGTTNIFVSEDAGSTWSAVQGQNNTFIPHHGVLSPSEHALYIPYCNGIGPYDGTDGYVMKYYIENSTWVDITPAVGGGFGYGALTVDLQKPGTVMVATLNEWSPDADIYRSINGGATWNSLWEASYPPPNYTLFVDRHYEWDVSTASWIATFTGSDTKLVGWMIDGLAIDPFDSDHMLYGTGLTIMGTRDLTDMDASPQKNITLGSMAVGVEETVALGLIAPPSGPLLVSVVGDVGGFVHDSLTSTPTEFTNPTWAGTVSGIDYAGAKPSIFVRVSQISGSTSVSVAISTDAGTSWNPYPGAPAASANVYGGKIAVSAEGISLIWSGATGFSGPQISTVASGSAFTPVSGLPGSTSVVTADRMNDTVFYAGSGSTLYISTNSGASFKSVSTSLGSTRSIVAIAANPFTAGDFYIATDAGIFHSTNYGSNTVALDSAGSSYALSVGVPSESGGTPTLFAAGTVGGVTAIYRTDDNGANWSLLSDAKHGFGNIPIAVLTADLRTYGQVFVGWGGRGIFVGHP